MNRKLRDLFVLVALGLALVWCIPAMGQVLKGSISGTATDPQGAVISGAQVKATNADTGAVYSTTSDSSGLFRFNLIPAGTYKVEVSAQGFKTLVQNNVNVTAGVDQGLGSVKLAVGGASETLEVTAAAPLVETSQAQVTNTFSGVELRSYAGIQENEGLDNLALFVPGVTNTRDNTFSNSNGPGFSNNGLRGRNNDQEIDGQNNNDNSVGGPSLFVSDTEFVQQYVLITNQFGPEYGRNAGSVVNLITKSGTNNWHGSLYGVENNSVLNSLTSSQKDQRICGPSDCLTQPNRLNNEFGGFTIGGPMVKNKMFIFGGFDQQIISTKSLYSTTNITPTPAGLAMLNGCFPTSISLQAFDKFGPYAISAGNPQPFHSTVFVPGISNGGPACGGATGVPFAGVQRTIPTPVHNFNWTARNDIQLGGDTLTARYLFNRGNTFNLDFGDGPNGYPVSVTALSQAILLSETHNFSSRMVNEARVGFNRLNVDFGGNTIGNTVPTAANLDQAVAQGTFQLPIAAITPTGPQAITADNLFGAANNLPQSRIVNTLQAQDNWNWVLGKHSIKAGVNWTYQRSPNTFLPNIDGTFRFSTWSRFIMNQPNRVRIAKGTPTLDFREYDTFAYGGDDWKIGQNLTLNLGVTWTYYGQPENLFHSLTTQQQTGPNPFWNPALPQSITTFPEVPSIKNSFGPSIGFAYSPQWGGFLTGHGKTTFRGGFRFLYDPPFYNIYLNESTAAPASFLQTFSGTQPTSRGIPAAGPTGPNVRNELNPFLTPGVFDPRVFAETNVSPNFGPDKVEAWSFGFEREITRNAAFEARYAGNRAYDLFQTVNGNPLISQLAADFPQFTTGLTPCAVSQQVPPFPVGLSPAPNDKGRVNCGQGVLRTRNNGGYSYYNGLQLEFRANNLFKQLTLRTGYTWSKNLDNVSEIFNTFGGGNTVAIAQNPLNTTKGEYSFSGLDIPATWTLIMTEQFPFFKEQHGFIGHLLGGWGFSGSYIMSSGQRYTPTQVFTATFSNPGATGASNQPGDYYDIAFWNAFFGAEPARPFIGNLKAPSSAVGIFAGDACNVFGATGPTAATTPVSCGGTLPDTTLLSLNALNQTGTIVPMSKNDVRFIMNGFVAQGIFKTPFGNTPRNVVQDAITSIGNVSFFKRIKMTERTSFEFHATMLNAFNHPNFQSVDPILEDAGAEGFLNGFGDPSLSGTVPLGYPSANTRIILFGGTVRF